MPLFPGDRIGHYEVLSLLGQGGMGEVYRAKDTRLKRDVALKVLPEAFARDPERMARFQREAEVLASLNHTNIAQIYGVEERALVMELVEGEAPKGPMPFDEAWKIASQIAAALEYAHDRGIIHRDLKPANIKVTPDGTVKLLDFGLAKAFSNQKEPSASPENSPTLTLGATEVGVILGTAAYMAPEQARGKMVDKRADIWSFGVVLYELLTGERVFTGEDAAETLAAVIHKQPDLAKVPRPARRLLEECLQKDPKQRLRDIGDARRMLSGDGSGADDFAAVAASELPRLGRAGWIAAGLMALVAAGASWRAWHATRPPELKPLVRLDVDLGSEVSLGSRAGDGADAILSPDGTRLVYVSQNRLFTRQLDHAEATELAGTEGGFGPFFSPDSRWVGFFAQGKLKKVAVEGGSALILCDSNSNPRGGSWGEDGNIIAALGNAVGLSRISAAGGNPTPITELAKGERTHRFPQILPGGKTVLFTVNTSPLTGFDGASIEVMSLSDRRRNTLVRGGTFGRYLPTGHLIYVNRGTLFAVPFDVDTLSMRGAPVPMLEKVSYSNQNGSAQVDFAGASSGSGTLIYRIGGTEDERFSLQWLEGSGKTEPILAKPGDYAYPRLSPDGQRIALVVSEGSNQDIWVYEWSRDTMTRLTLSGGTVSTPLWSPNGRYILFQVPDGIAWTRSDRAGKPQSLIQIMTPMKYLYPTSFSPDGKRLAFHEGVSPIGDLWTVSVKSEGDGLLAGKPEPFLQTPFDERQPAFSPDGKRLAYSSDLSGIPQIYVEAFSGAPVGPGGKWQVSNTGGQIPTWSRNGHELFFRSQDNRIMVTNYTVKGDSFAPDKPRVWFEGQLAETGPRRNFDLSPDGKRIVALMPVNGPGEKRMQGHVVFLENFFDEVRRKVPTGK